MISRVAASPVLWFHEKKEDLPFLDSDWLIGVLSYLRHDGVDGVDSAYCAASAFVSAFPLC